MPVVLLLESFVTLLEPARPPSGAAGARANAGADATTERAGPLHGLTPDKPHEPEEDATLLEVAKDAFA